MRMREIPRGEQVAATRIMRVSISRQQCPVCVSRVKLRPTIRHQSRLSEAFPERERGRIFSSLGAHGRLTNVLSGTFLRASFRNKRQVYDETLNLNKNLKVNESMLISHD